MRYSTRTDFQLSASYCIQISCGCPIVRSRISVVGRVMPCLDESEKAYGSVETDSLLDTASADAHTTEDGRRRAWRAALGASVLVVTGTDHTARPECPLQFHQAYLAQYLYLLRNIGVAVNSSKVASSASSLWKDIVCTARPDKLDFCLENHA